MTTTSLALRVFYQLPHGRLSDSEIWASPTSNRILSESTVHTLLNDYRIDKNYKLGVEVFDIPIPTAVETVSNVTGHECVKYEWQRTEFGLILKDDPIPGFI